MSPYVTSEQNCLLDRSLKNSIVCNYYWQLTGPQNERFINVILLENMHTIVPYMCVCVFVYL